MVIEVLIAQRNPKHSLANQRRNLMLDQFRPPPIDEAIGKTINQPDRSIGRCQQQSATVRGDRAAIKAGNHPAPFNRCKVE
jgi:hypothetical protein